MVKMNLKMCLLNKLEIGFKLSLNIGLNQS